jgi:small-conductance mechanosensitive channel
MVPGPVTYQLPIRESPFGTRFGYVTHVKGRIMNNIVYIVGLVVVVLFVLSFFGLR